MICSKNIPAVFLIVAVLLGPSSGAAEPNESKIPLRFVNGAPLEFREPRHILDGPQSPRTSLATWRPPYAVGIPLDGPVNYFPLVNGQYTRRFFDDAEKDERLSPRQKQFLEATRWVFESENPFTHHKPEDPNRPREFLLYAMTLEDARALVRFHADLRISFFESEIGFQTRRLKKDEDSVRSLQQQLRDLEVAVRSAETTIVEVQKRVGYRTRQEAVEAIGELDRMRTAAQVDLAGIQAKLAAIQKWQAENPPQVVHDRLRAMFVEESIALDAAQARMKMATQLREDANKFADARQILDTAGQEKQKFAAEIEAKQNNAEQTREWLEGREERRPRIGDRPITIYPVEWVVSNTDLLELSTK